MEAPREKAFRWIRVYWAMGIIILVTLLCTSVMGRAAEGWHSVWNYRIVFWKGWLLTIFLSVASLLLSCLVGFAVAVARRSRLIPIRSAAFLYIEIERGTPFLVQILFLYYVLFNFIGLENRLVAGVILLSLFSGAYLAEIIRSGMESIPASQLESARAIGLTTIQIYRFVIGPQALRQILPPLAGQFASLIKDSSLLSIIGLGEFTLAAQQVNSATYCTLESYLPLAMGYLVLTIPISSAARFLETHLNYET